MSNVYRKSILCISVTASLDTTHGMEILDIILLQNERDDFQLSNDLKTAIIKFACVFFALRLFVLPNIKLVIEKCMK